MREEDDKRCEVARAPQAAKEAKASSSSSAAPAPAGKHVELYAAALAERQQLRLPLRFIPESRGAWTQPWVAKPATWGARREDQDAASAMLPKSAKRKIRAERLAAERKAQDCKDQ